MDRTSRPWWARLAGPRAKWLVIAAWLLAAVALGPLQPRLQEATVNDPVVFLPSDAESTRVVGLLGERFESGRTAPALVVYRNVDGLTAEDEAAIAEDVEAFADVPGAQGVVSPLDEGAEGGRPALAGRLGRRRRRPARRDDDRANRARGRRAARDHRRAGRRRRARVVGHGRGGRERRRRRGLRLDRRDTPPRDDRPHPRPAPAHLPLAGGRARPARCRRTGVRRRRRDRLRARLPGGARRERSGDRDSRDPHVRRRDRLLPPDRRTLSRGARPRRGQARGA